MSELDRILAAAQALAKAGRLAEAEVQVDGVIRRAPRDGRAHRLKGLIRQQAGDAAAALASFDKALALNPDDPVTWSGRGVALQALSRPLDALESFDRALALKPDAGLTLYNRGQTLAALRRYGPALESYDRALALQPGLDDARFRRGLIALLLGRFDEGWRDYDARWDIAAQARHGMGTVTPELATRLTRRISAADLIGREVLVLSEQGVGDQIMFASMIPDLARVARQVTLACEPRLTRLFAQSFPDVSVVDARAPLTGVRPDLIVAAGDLGHAFRPRREDFPGLPYLAPRPEVTEAWRARLGGGSIRRIGLSWRGGMAHTNGEGRSLTLDQLTPLLDLDGVEFVSLQYGDVSEEVARFNAGRPNPIRLFPRAEIDDFEALAGLVGALDRVVSVQTALVHLCGAIGAPCLTLIPASPEWRYGATGATMPWYGSVALARQDNEATWAPVIDRIVQEIRSHA
ncbi:tetratricopeptide repeat-containing glycosyltransferase family protein [Phenylobacterium aquaticum]|uniref:tetratricopeptide repeat-containing glycosyltransferase family protein n=1 Tax=Phenylobacterium aquaticum TaxID=1763816 RepID=UPI0026ED6302|nr:tetratricopeptide repeat-containing glycosyltransferase family protein [Phenylobacterium aquaticum]